MKANGNIMLERLKDSTGAKDGCSVVYLKMLKSDLSRVLKSYMSFSELDVDVEQVGGCHRMSISININEFFDVGHGG